MYDQQILRILLDVGAHGISVMKLAKHVYNHFCTLFFQPDFSEIYHYTQQYVRRHSRTPQGLIEHAEKRGHYRLNTRNTAAQQLMLEFCEDIVEAEEDNEPIKQDLSLDLFPF